MHSTTATTLDPAEIARFSAIAAEWWDEKGKFAPLHRINPVRLKYISAQIDEHFSKTQGACPQLKILDIGCGGGLVSEPMARRGFTVTGIDGGEKNINTARVHAEESGLSIDYRVTTAEALAGSGASYDIVLALEIVEHVADVELFLKSVAQLVRPGGLLVMSTLNRTPKAFALAILGAEYVLRWLPRGTHDWKKFFKPQEIIRPLEQYGLELVEMRGLVLNPLKWQWELSASDVDVNYTVVLKK